LESIPNIFTILREAQMATTFFAQNGDDFLI